MEGVGFDPYISSSFFYLLLKIWFLSPEQSQHHKISETPVRFRDTGSKTVSVLWLQV